jgi:catabolite regulation protein CreA
MMTLVYMTYMRKVCSGSRADISRMPALQSARKVRFHARVDIPMKP